MQFTIRQDKLQQGLDTVKRIAQKSASLPILNNVLLEAKQNFLNLKTTDLQVGINWWGLAKVKKEGRITIPVKVLSSFISLLPNQPVKLSLSKENILSIECKNYQSQIKGQDPEEFPIIPQVKEGKKFALKSSSFAQGLEKVYDVATTSLARPEISGVYFNFEKDLLKIVATDSFRLAEKMLELEHSIAGEAVIIPQKTARELMNIVEQKPEDIEVAFSPNQIMFERAMEQTDHPQIRLTSKVVEGQYPDYQEIIPDQFKTKITLQKEEFLNQIKAASLFAGKINEVAFRVDSEKNKVKIISQNPSLGEHSSVISGQIQGEKVEASFNYRFLVDGLSKIESSKVLFGLNGDSGPGALLPPQEQRTFLYIVMPIKPS